jgi:pimeloyl-ACP methyl ester carboxylesterase
MQGSFLLVHSPLVGPSSWAALAERAAAQGVDVVVPDLTPVAEAEPPWWKMIVGTAAAAARGLDGPVVVVGHSGAGAYLPEIGHRLGDRLGALVFVDAVVPPRRGAHQTPAGMKRLLEGQTVDGMLLPWLDWWPKATVEELLPNSTDRDVLAADMPRLFRSFYDEAVPVPDEWSDRWCAYLQLSAAYEAEFEEAGDRGWPRAVVDGTHLSIHTEPDQVLRAIESLLNTFAA